MEIQARSQSISLLIENAVTLVAPGTFHVIHKAYFQGHPGPRPSHAT